jgi:hypothetical protein
MSTCQGIVRSELQQSSTGFPMTVTVHCRQTVGITTWRGSLGQTLSACSRHFGQVVAKDRLIFTARRVGSPRSAPAFPEPQTAAEWQGIRPEVGRAMR